ncbi:MAG: hypothetical protein EA366_01745 [Spirulina sp. DLM2.Bin59]|nr:MAG: hypothetical protein EA366_01745 [Spirulina sp. DLM2.Bin59]
MAELIYPTLDLFLYDLRNGLGETPREIEHNRARFHGKMPEAVRSRLTQQDQHFEAEYQELLLPERCLFFTGPEDAPLKIGGYYYPVRLNDTYGLLIDASVEDQSNPQTVDCFGVLRQTIAACLGDHPPSLGQTWMLSGWRSPHSTASDEAIAQAIYEQFIPEGNWQQDLQGQGSLLGANLFELWRYRSTLIEHHQAALPGADLPQNQHLLISIFPDQATAARAAELYYDDWLRLFGFRNKMLWAYEQSRQIKQLIKADFTTVQASRSQSQNFTAFRETLIRIQDALNHYKLNLIQLDFQGRTIDINLSNYKKRLQRMVEQGDQQTDLNFLADFVRIVEEKYLLQIHKDSENMQLGLRLLEDAINATQSRLEVEKAERDRDFQEVLKYLGVGWAAATVASSKIDVSKVENDPIKDQLVRWQVAEDWAGIISPVTYTLLVAVAIAAGFGGCVWTWHQIQRLWHWLTTAKAPPTDPDRDRPQGKTLE